MMRIITEFIVIISTLYTSMQKLQTENRRGATERKRYNKATKIIVKRHNVT